jgi:hypothetical protein
MDPSVNLPKLQPCEIGYFLDGLGLRVTKEDR